MGKRTRPHSDNYESIVKKFKKLERKLLHARRRDRHREPRLSESTSSSNSSSSSSSTSRGRSRSRTPPARSREPTRSRRCNSSPPQEPIYIEDEPTLVPIVAATNPQSSTSTSESVVDRPPSTNAVEPSVDSQPSTSRDLDDEVLVILGDDPSQKKLYAKDIDQDIAIRLQHICTSGLSKEARKDLLERYLMPGNCTLIDAPSLNLEVKAAVSEQVIKRDKGIEQRQKQTAAAISSLTEALTLLIDTEPKNTILIRLLMDASKLLCDGQNADSVVRRSFVLFNLKKEFKDQLLETKIDQLLFGKDLAEILKAAKSISRSGADMKPIQIKTSKNTSKPPASAPQKNWRAPPLNQRPKGTQRFKGPVQKNRHDNSSKQSSRPGLSRNHR